MPKNIFGEDEKIVRLSDRTVKTLAKQARKKGYDLAYPCVGPDPRSDPDNFVGISRWDSYRWCILMSANNLSSIKAAVKALEHIPSDYDHT